MPSKITLLISALFIFSVIFRLSINYSTPLIPKVNGAYYLVQTRSILESGKLAFIELPLVFYVEALGSKLLNSYGLDAASAILHAVKLTDSVLPALQAIPIFFLILFWKREKPARMSYFYASAGAIFSIANFQSVSMISDFQKNSIGLMWFAFYIYYLKKHSGEHRLKDSLLAGLFFF